MRAGPLVSDEPQPGWVEANVVDAFGAVRRFFDKPPIFTADTITADTPFPVAAALRVRILDDAGPGRIEVETIDVEADDGTHRFVLDAARVDAE